MTKDIKELNKWRITPCSWTERLNSVKMSVFPKLICGFSAIQVKIPASFFMEINVNLKIICSGRRLRIANTILKKKKLGGLMLPDFKNYCEAT